MYEHLTDEQLRELEERLYDEEIEGGNTWFERDRVLWEMNRRAALKRTQRQTPAS